MAKIRSNRRNTALRGNVGVLAFPKVTVSLASAQTGMGWLLFAVAVIASYLLARVALVNRLSSLPVQSSVKGGSIIQLKGPAAVEVADEALKISQASVQTERLQGSSADAYFQPTGGSDLQATGSGDSLQMSQPGYNQQGSVGTARR